MNEEFKIALRRLNHLTSNLFTDVQLDEARSPYVERTLAEMKSLMQKLNWEYFYGEAQQPELLGGRSFSDEIQ